MSAWIRIDARNRNAVIMTTLISALPHVFLPLTIIIGITSLIGFLGNAMAFYVFHFRFPSTGFNKLMATLAMYDVMACFIHMPLDIATFFPVGFLRSYLCKITCFQLAFTSTGSALVLLAIAFVRYHGIHRPLQGLFSTKSALYVITGSFLTAAGIGMPITFLFGAGELTTDSNTTAAICAVEKRFSESSGPITYYFVLAGLYLITLCFHTFLYAKSVITVWNRRRMFVSVTGNKNAVIMTPAVPRAHRTAITGIEQRSDSIRNHQRPQPKPRNHHGNHVNDGGGSQYPVNVFAQSSSTGDSPSHILQSIHSNNNTQGSNTKANQPRTHHQNNPISPPAQITSYANASTLPVRGQNGIGSNVNQTSYRVLAVVIALSTAFFLSYVPHFGVMFYLFTHDNDIFTESAQSLVFELLMRSFFLNNVLDIVIYGLLSADFRREANRALKKLFCIRQCRHLIN